MTEFTRYITETTIAGNELWRILCLFGIILLSFFVGRVLRTVLTHPPKKLNRIDRGVVPVFRSALGRSAGFVCFVVGIKLGLHFLHMNETVAALADSVTSVLFTLSIGYVVYNLVDIVDYGLGGFAAKTPSKLDDILVPMVRKSLRVTVVVLVLLQIATVLSDKPLTSILAGLGVGGLAVALAAQDTLKHLFGSLVILADKPFELGDRVVVDGHDGPVEEVGFRSTRIRTLNGHLVTVPNGELANKTILNIGKRPYIKRSANVTVTYDTTPEKLQRAVDILKELLVDHEGMHPDFPPRVYFNEFNDTSLNIMVLYWYHPPDYWAFCAFNERFNKEVLTRFNEEGIEFAFPTQTLFLASDPARPLSVQTS